MEAYYTPATEKKQPLVEGLETIPVRLKEEAIVKYLSQTIYSSWKSALRELYANELTAAKKAARMGAKPIIEITLDPKTRKLTIHGKDSLGITKGKFEVLRYYGRSGNFSGEDAGMFGFGFKSYLGINDEVKVETFARETGDRYGFIGVKGVEFREMSEEEVRIDSYGTKVSLVIKRGQEGEQTDADEDEEGEGKRIRLTEVVETLEDVCKFAEIDTYLNLPSPIKTKMKYNWWDKDYWHTEREAGRTKLNRTPREYAKKTYGEKGFDFELDMEDFYFYGYLAMDRDGDKVGIDCQNGEVRLVWMPIQATIRNPGAATDDKHPRIEPSYPLTFYVVNLKNERKFLPTADRERLKEGQFDPVHNKIVRFLKGEFTKMEIRSFDDYRNSQYKPVLNTVSWTSSNADYFTEATKRVCTVLGWHVGGVAAEDEGQERWHRSWGVPHGAYQTRLRNLIAKSRHLFMLPRKRKGNGFILPLGTVMTLGKVLRTKYPDAEVFLYPGFEHYWDLSELAAIEKRLTTLVEQFGVLDAGTEAKKVREGLGKDWRKAAGIEVREKEPLEEVVVWSRASDYNRIDPVRRSVSDVGRNTVRVKGNIKDWVSLLREYYVKSYGFTKDLSGIKGGMTEERFAEEVSSTNVMTAEGETTIGDAADGEDRNIIIFLFPEPEILKFYRPRGRKVVLAPSDESAFGAIAYLKLKKKEHAVVKAVEESLVKEPVEPVSKTDPAEMNYLYIAQKRLGKSANPELMELLMDALSNSMPEEMMPLVDTATKYSRYLS